jgi:hypothetical protein
VIIILSLGVPIKSNFILFGVSFTILLFYTVMLKYRKKDLPGWLIGSISVVPIVLLILRIVYSLFPDSLFWAFKVQGFIVSYVSITLLIIGFVIYFLRNKAIRKKHLLIYIGLFFFTLNSLFISAISVVGSHNIAGTCLEKSLETNIYHNYDFSKFKTKSLVYGNGSCGYSDSLRLLFTQHSNTSQLKEYMVLLISIFISLCMQILFYRKTR